ncbi:MULTISPECIES: hypothetical protein [Brucella/Ochrobactrum group]|jgi:hypothetical protein|uniref:Uncharacterized protein n=1 Tax=Brucella pseudintermedia TaxID=370111 RepID=A0ABY5UHK0_9HYPH|nr:MULTISPECIES: hypothetical protein [Brucella/Ochrobactrum group]MCO7728592.1 hypothetical protein [Brucella intermedia]NKE74303.1 hypothetical protein [Ochrobactrum sp. MC-1LL]TWH04528.1 hypothetical protein L614_000100002290 [Ochrobactrum sp. J50]UWL61484.1 hypothetical protein NIK97_16370 [Brucella pseudintermedia]WPM82231.1 hypothetical protein R5W60_13700 [Brucella pseudintermedia]
MITLKWLAVLMFAVALLGLASLFITSDKGDVSPESPTPPASSPTQP